jgi:tetratricopeptide (TPR) repeat protein
VDPYNGRVLDAETDGATPAATGPVDVGRTAEDHERLLALALSRPADAVTEAGRVLAQNPDAGTASVAHQARAIVLRDAGRTADAIRELRVALRLARASGTPERALDVQATLGVTLVFAGRTVAGLAAMDEAVAGSSGVLAGRILARRGALLRVLGRHDDALSDLREAIALLRRGGDTVWEARSRNHRFLVYCELGQAVRADRDLAAAERLFAAAGQELESAMAVHSRAAVAFQAGDLPAALGFLDEAEARYAALSVLNPTLSLDRCAFLLAAGLAREALAVADEAIRRHGGDGGQATKKAELLFAAACAAQAAGEPAAAARRATAARDLFRGQHRPWWQSRASFVLLESRYGAGERGEPLRAQASRIADRLDTLGAEETATAHLLAGRLAAEQGRNLEAERHFARAARFRHRGPTFGRAAGWLAHALRAEARGATRATLIACRRGLDAAEEHQRTLGAAELRAHATAYGTELAAIAQRHAVRRGDARMLLMWTERWRAAALAIPPVRPPDDRDLAADLAALRAAVLRLDAARSAGAMTARLDQERLRLEASIRSRTRRTAGVATRRTAGAALPRHDSAFSRSDIEELPAGLDDHRLIEIVALDDMVYAVTVVGRRVRAHAVGPVATAIREVDLARFMLRRLAHGRPPAGALAGLDAAGHRLQQVLLGPAASDVDGGPVVMVPPSRLNAVPWALLPSLRRTRVQLAPSAATWLRAGHARRPRHRRVAFVIGPGLQGTVDEVTKIAQSYPDMVVLGGDHATADRVLAELDGAWMAHIAAHGHFRAENPLFSSLRLDDGPLTVYDLGRLRHAPLRLVLSSCESGVGTHVGADELLGMVTALVPLGTASLLASVVPVNDAATTTFMVAFHDHLRTTGSSFADAVLAAQVEAADDPVAVATAFSFVALGR